TSTCARAWMAASRCFGGIGWACSPPPLPRGPRTTLPPIVGSAIGSRRAITPGSEGGPCSSRSASHARCDQAGSRLKGGAYNTCVLLVEPRPVPCLSTDEMGDLDDGSGALVHAQIDEIGTFESDGLLDGFIHQLRCPAAVEKPLPDQMRLRVQ